MRKSQRSIEKLESLYTKWRNLNRKMLSTDYSLTLIDEKKMHKKLFKRNKKRKKLKQNHQLCGKICISK